MDRLVKPDLKEIDLAFKKGQKSSTTFRLTNLMHTMSVAVCLTTSNPTVFTISQSFSILSPLSSASYTLTLSQPSDQPPLSTPPDTVTVRSSMLPIGKAHPDDLRRLFSRPGPHVFRDASLLISFVGPHVVEFLTAHSTNVPELSFLLTKAISGCTKSQLTKLLSPAISFGRSNIVSSLIDSGGDVSVKDSHGRSLLSTAVRAGNIDVIKILMASGCDINDPVDSDGRTPVHIAASLNHIEQIQFFVSVGANTETPDRNNWTPLHCAASEGHLETVEFLLNCSNVKYALNKDGKTAFQLAFDKGHSHLFDLLCLGDLLHRGARLNDVNGLKSCIAEGAKLNGRDQNGWTALHRAAFKGRIECVKLLIEYGAEIDVVDDSGCTPLHCAVESGNLQVALFLVANGAKASAKSIKGLVNLKKSESFKHLLPYSGLGHSSMCYVKEQV